MLEHRLQRRASVLHGCFTGCVCCLLVLLLAVLQGCWA